MKMLFLIPFLFVLSGCLTTTPVKRTFPEVPQELVQACPDLKLVEPTEKLSDVLKVVTDNYSQYHECKIKVDTWIEWYKSQKQIFESVK
jgi:hypothetical protein